MIRRIGIVAPEFPPGFGGVQAYSFGLCKALSAFGYELTILVPETSESFNSNSDFVVSPIKALKLRKRYDKELIKHYDVDIWHCLNASYAWVSEFHPNVFLSVHGNDFLSVYYPTARLDLRERFNFQFGARLDHWLGKKLTKLLIASTLPNCKRVFANSNYTKQRLLAAYPNCISNISVVSPGISEFYLGHTVPDGKIDYSSPRLVTVCRLSEERKNIHLVLKVLSSLKGNYNFHYTIVGDGYLKRELMNLVAELELQERVTFTGNVNKLQLRKELLQSDLFILTSSAKENTIEGFGIVYLEANACGVPVLAAKVGGAIDAVQDNVSGFFVDSPELTHIYLALVEFMSGQRTFDRHSCRAFAEAYGWNKTTRKIVDIYEEHAQLT